MNSFLIDLAKKADFARNFRDKRALRVYGYFRKFLHKGDLILEIGAGSGDIIHLLKNDHFEVRGVDIQDLSLFSDIKPIVYDGKTIPFKDKSFDTILLITVLHHTKNPEAILKEARRVAKRVIVVEDIFTGQLQKYVTFVMDSVTNFEFIGHPHSNRDDSEWRETFKKMGFTILNSSSETFWKVFLAGIYILKS